MRWLAVLVLSASLIPLGMPAPRAGAQATGVPPILEGGYVPVGGAAGARAAVIAAFEPTIRMLPYFTQGMVRSRLEERLALPARIDIDVPDDPAGDVSVRYTTEREIVVACPVGGTTSITTAEGRTVPVSQRVRLGWLEQIFSGETGSLTVMLSTEPDGRVLHADATMRSERLPTPVSVRVDYERAP